MKVILVFSILFVNALARPLIFGEDGLVHKAVEKAHEAGQKIQETLHTARVKVKEDILILEGKVHNTVVNILKNEKSESANEKHDDTKPHESNNVDYTENTSEKAANDNKDNTLSYKKPDVNHQAIGNGKVADDNTENSFDFEKISKLASHSDHRGTVDQADVYGNHNNPDDGTDQFHVVYDKNGKAIVVPNTNNVESSNTHSNMRHGASVNQFNEHNSFPVNHDIYTNSENPVEKQPNYKLRRTEDSYIGRTAVARSGATARNAGPIDVRNGS